jgi:hypothetical protein
LIKFVFAKKDFMKRITIQIVFFANPPVIPV